MLIFDEFKDPAALEQWYAKMRDDCRNSYPLIHFSEIDPSFKTDMCVDIGCNIGQFSLIASHCFKQVVAFEPSYITCLSAKFWLHKENNRRNVTVYNMAVSKNTGDFLNLTCEEHSGKLTSGNASVVHNPQKENYEKVLTISLDDVFRICETDFIDYLKIDCEGSEYDILLGKDITKIGIIVLELHGLPDQNFTETSKELLDYLATEFNIETFGAHNAVAVNKKFLIKPSHLSLGGRPHEA